MLLFHASLIIKIADFIFFLAAALDPKALYTSKLVRKSKSKHSVTLDIKKLASSSSKASAAINQFTFFSKQVGLFGGAEARKSALYGRCSAGNCIFNFLYVHYFVDFLCFHSYFIYHHFSR